ncbi:MAG: autotransporter outer membrane beta-barrel domain-containing protein, partial [Rhodanobacteraceae bacterium]
TFNGISEIAGGTLTVNGSIVSSVTVDAGGTLNGIGSTTYDVTNNGTVESAGSKAGQGLTIGGNLVDGASSTTAVALGNPLQVHGTASVAGTMNVLAPPSGYTVQSTENLVTAGSVSGTFAKLTFASNVFYTGTLAYTSTQVNVNLTQTNVTAAAASAGIVDPASVGAAQRVQVGFDTINATLASGGTPSSAVLQGAGAIQHSPTPAVAQATLQSLSGQLHAASAAMLLDGIDASGNALSEHFDDLLSGQARPGIWYSNLGWQGDLQRSGFAGATFRSSGGMAGTDLRIGAHALFGFAAGQSLGFGQLDTAWDHNRTWMNNLAMYGGLVNGPWYANAQVASGWYREDMQRLLQLGAMGTLVGTGSTGRYIAGTLEGGRTFQVGVTRLVPFADVRYQRLDLGGFTEQGGLGYGLTADARSAGRLQAGLGLRAERGWRLANGMRMQFDGSAGWQHTLRQYGSVFNASFTGFNDWLPVEGIGLSRNTAIVRAGLSLWPSKNFGLRLGYMREQDQQQRAGSVMLQGTVAF